MNGKHEFFTPIDIHKLIFRIGEVSKICNVSARQLRYWDQKGFIASKRHGESSSRVYDFPSLLRIGSIKGYLDDGYTLKAAVKMTNDKQETIRNIHRFLTHAVYGVERIDGRPMINLGYFDQAKTSYLYGYLTEDEETVYRVVPINDAK
ncbi:MerR family transcriptional regulator [Nicoliella spurrieriana]|uniref:MerR family transcriptional regulator n=1 Tax=Nicoliella spurrieriana TaxID=2925830 RepID=A0A976RSP8_9LACO|nr:MerR family transcriptional regulator [Nicoliella spurrieriana]UQS87142.1 MerR family transcriptional regulator [Nicoliella spurrieriana]